MNEQKVGLSHMQEVNEQRHRSSEENPWRVPDEYLGKWQNTVDLLAKLLFIPAAVITRYTAPYLEILRASQNTQNPFTAGQKDYAGGHFCETVIRNEERLQVECAPELPQWRNAPELRHGIVSYLGYPVRWPDGTVFGTICILDTRTNHFGGDYDELMTHFQHIVERDLALLVRDRQLQKAVSQRDLLLREVRHRIKNHLNQIYSVVSLWELEGSGGDPGDFAGEMKRRITSLGTLYSHLEISEGLPSVRFDHYLRGIVQRLQALYSEEVDISFRADRFSANPNAAMYLGLLAMEVLTNTFKYAFAEWGAGHIMVELLNGDESIILRISDNGEGIDVVQPQKGGQQGLSLICSLVNSLGGSWEVKGGEGTEWCFEFPASKFRLLT